MKNILLVSVILLAGCAPKTETFWEKSGASQQDFYQDKGQCDAQAFSVASGNLMQIAIVQNGCMRGKGWYLVERRVGS